MFVPTLYRRFNERSDWHEGSGNDCNKEKWNRCYTVFLVPAFQGIPSVATQNGVLVTRVSDGDVSSANQLFKRPPRWFLLITADRAAQITSSSLDLLAYQTKLLGGLDWLFAHKRSI
jgi:hypothetical protein